MKDSIGIFNDLVILQEVTDRRFPRILQERIQRRTFVQLSGRGTAPSIPIPGTLVRILTLSLYDVSRSRGLGSKISEPYPP